MPHILFSEETSVIQQNQNFQKKEDTIQETIHFDTPKSICDLYHDYLFGNVRDFQDKEIPDLISLYILADYLADIELIYVLNKILCEKYQRLHNKLF